MLQKRASMATNPTLVEISCCDIGLLGNPSHRCTCAILCNIKMILIRSFPFLILRMHRCPKSTGIEVVVEPYTIDQRTTNTYTDVNNIPTTVQLPIKYHRLRFACFRNIVLNASLPGGSMAEATPHGRPELCAFWDAVAEAKRPTSGTIYA